MSNAGNLRVTTHNIGSAKRAIGYGWADYAGAVDNDVVCIQSLNIRENDAAAMALQAVGYHATYALGVPAPSKYSVGILSRLVPGRTDVRPPCYLDARGQWLAVKHDGVWFASLYAILEHHADQHAAFLSEVAALPKDEPIVLCGDFNTIQDLERDANQKGRGSGYGDGERSWLRDILKMGFIDAYRAIHAERSGYTWWAKPTMFHEDRGTRIDLQLVRGLTPVSATIHRDWCAQRIAAGGAADHAPLTVEYNRI
jgi:exodeoxyribonuclease III